MNIEDAKQYLLEMKKDGWDCGFLYGPRDQYFKCERDGFTVFIDLRIYPNKKYRAERLNAWAPDGIHIKLPKKYSFEEMKKNVLLCDHCGNYVEETFRVAFASRACKKCRPIMQAELEKPGWAD